MTMMFRIIVTAFVVVATFYFCYWVPFALIPGIPWGVSAIASYSLAMAAGWYTFTRTATVSTSLAKSVGYWSLVIGAIGFVGGFFGPMIFAPGANQGPLLGILITGPLGVLVGALGGLVHWLVQRKRAGSDPST
jgi:hypothetical protein